DLNGPRTFAAQHVYDRPAFVVEIKTGNRRSWLFFDAEKGLLLRRREFFPTYYAEHTYDIEYDDYRKVGTMLLPFTMRVLNAAGSGLTIREFQSREVGKRLAPPLFDEPAGSSAKQ